MRAIDVMTTQVVTATPQTTAQDAAKLMINNRISGLPIVEGDRQLVGLLCVLFATPAGATIAIEEIDRGHCLQPRVPSGLGVRGLVREEVVVEWGVEVESLDGQAIEVEEDQAAEG